MCDEHLNCCHFGSHSRWKPEFYFKKNTIIRQLILLLCLFNINASEQRLAIYFYNIQTVRIFLKWILIRTNRKEKEEIMQNVSNGYCCGLLHIHTHFWWCEMLLTIDFSFERKFFFSRNYEENVVFIISRFLIGFTLSINIYKIGSFVVFSICVLFVVFFFFHLFQELVNRFSYF